MLFKILMVVIFLAVLSLGLYQNRIYKISIWRLVIIVTVGAIVSYWGIHLLAYIERGYWGGWSFFGCIFFVPIAYLLLERVLKVKYSILMDFAGPMCALFFVLIKINCAIKGCCWGIYILTMKNGVEIYFPSPMVEALIGIIIFLGLLHLQKAEDNREKTAPVFLVSYGIMRFVLSFFRENPTQFRWFKTIHLSVPTGQVWALLCIIWGIIWMRRIQIRIVGRRVSLKECFFFGIAMFRAGEAE